MLIVLDTNVLVSSLLKRLSPPATIVDAILGDKITLIVDQRIFNEYREVLHRPKLKIPSNLADPILRFIAQSAFWVEIEPVEFSPELVFDPDDLPFGEAAVNGHAEALVTGNVKHFQFLTRTGIKVGSPVFSGRSSRKYKEMIPSDQKEMTDGGEQNLDPTAGDQTTGSHWFEL